MATIIRLAGLLGLAALFFGAAMYKGGYGDLIGVFEYGRASLAPAVADASMVWNDPEATLPELLIYGFTGGFSVLFTLFWPAIFAEVFRFTLLQLFANKSSHNACGIALLFAAALISQPAPASAETDDLGAVDLSIGAFAAAEPFGETELESLANCIKFAGVFYFVDLTRGRAVNLYNEVVNGRRWTKYERLQGAFITYAWMSRDEGALIHPANYTFLKRCYQTLEEHDPEERQPLF